MHFNRNTIEGPHKGEVRLSGGFRTNAGSSPTVIYGNWISSVSRTGAGTYTVQMKNEFKGLHCIGKQATLQLAAPGDSKVVLGAYDASAGTQVVATITTAAAADIAANADNIVWLELVVSYGRIADGSPNRDS
jgi:hypothetical protein